jgi:hypothetical protein
MQLLNDLTPGPGNCDYARNIREFPIRPKANLKPVPKKQIRKPPLIKNPGGRGVNPRIQPLKDTLIEWARDVRFMLLTDPWGRLKGQVARWVDRAGVNPELIVEHYADEEF